MRTRSFLNVLFACLTFIVTLAASQSQAETRRAFLIGNQAYKDGDIKQLRRAVNDAKDVAKDLEEVGFDKKNIKVVTDIKNKNAFDKEFDAFLKTVEAGDTVFFYYSGHGFGVEADNNNYLLFTDLKSPFSFARAQLPEKERKNAAVVRSKVRYHLEAYNRDEIPLSGVSATEIEQKIYQRRAKTVIMILDACRSLAKSDGDEDDDAPARSTGGGNVGSRMITTRQPPRNFLVIYSAAFGEQAVESLGGEGRNSLFTEIFRAEMMRPGQSLKELAERVKLMVRATSQGAGEQQDPEYIANGASLDDTYLIDSIGRERFQMSQEKCQGGLQDWAEIRNRRKRDLLNRHIRRFDTCETAEYARRRLSELALSADDSDDFQDRCLEAKEVWEKQVRDKRDPKDLDDHLRRYEGCATAELARRWLAARGSAPSVSAPSGAPDRQPGATAARTARDIRNVNDCDLLAASDLDKDRPADVPGLPFEKIIADDAIEACLKVVNENTPRYLFNLGRAYHKRGSDPELSREERRDALRSARLAYEDAQKRSYGIALSHLASLLEAGDGVRTYKKEAIDLLKRGAEQRQPHAMYLLGLHVYNGDGVERDSERALELFRSAGEGGIVAAKVEAGWALINRRPFWRPRAGIALLEEAAAAGSTRAAWLLAVTYSKGSLRRRPTEKKINEIPSDDDLVLLWLGRLAEQGDTTAQAALADRMQSGLGVAAPQPEASERYWRLAAQGGNPTAQVTFADRMRRGFVLVKQEYGAGDEGVKVLEQAMSQGSPQAALALAEIYRNGELGQPRNPRKAVTHAFKAIELATQTDASPREGEPFPEMAAAHLLIEMIKANEAVSSSGSPLLTSDEIERLERFYGKVEPSSKQVKIRRLYVNLTCGFGDRVYDKKKKEYHYEVERWLRKPVWVWDWGRVESPTESQFRNLERDTNCDKNGLLRRTLIDIYDQARKHDVPYADLVEQKIKIAMGDLSAPAATRSKKRGRRR